MFDERTVGRKEFAAILLVAAAIVAVVIIVLVQSYAPQPPSKSNPAEGAAREAIDQMYQEELATAKAAALLKAQAREAEVNAAEELLNSLANASSSLPDDLPPEAEAITADPPPGSRPATSGPSQASEPAVAPGSVKGEEGQAVNVQDIINSVRDAGAKGGKND